MFPIRDDQPKYSTPVVTILIVVLNVMAFLFELSLDDYSRNHFIMSFGLIPGRFHFSALLTSMFMHGGWFHIIGNIMFLWAFGRTIEDAMGSEKFIVFYLLSGLAAGMTQVLLSPYSTVPVVGASGAIAGVMGAYLVTFPRARIHTIVFIFVFFTSLDIPAVFILVYWFITQLFSGLGSIGYSHISEGGTAWFAHIGGFIAGIVFIKLMGIQNRFYRRGGAHW